MSYTAKELEEATIEFFNTTDDSDDYGNVWGWFKSEGGWGEEDTYLDVPGFGKLKYEDSFGGEGQGDDYWVVVKLEDRYFRVNGWYSSWEGGELDGTLEEVTPKEVKVIEWETV